MLLSQQMRERRDAKQAELDALVNATETRGATNMTDEEFDVFVTRSATLRKELDAADVRVAELVETEAAEARAAAARVEVGAVEKVEHYSPAQVNDPPVYVRDGSTGHSYFRDLALANTAEGQESRSAVDRLRRNGKAAAAEQRALGNTNATGGSGGEFSPPSFLVQDWIALLRPGRVTADLFTKAPIPPGRSSISIPKVMTGNTVALQSTQNTLLAQTDMTTASVTTGFATIGGKAVWSQQLMDQSEIPFDQIIATDLAAAYNMTFAAQIFAGAGTGSGTNAVINGLSNATAGVQGTLTGTTAAAFYSAASGLLAQFASVRYAMPSAWVVHPRRWFWLLAQTDSTGRPLVVPQDVAFNPMATNDNQVVSGMAGGRLLGLPVFLDPSVPTNLGPNTNQDAVYLAKWDDFWLFESTPQAEAFRSPYSESLGILFRLYSYVGTILNRQTASLGRLTGAGLVPPSF
ncbi:MAG: hypothetical protein NVS3B26_16460 [Mycobacteriales bacterium]